MKDRTLQNYFVNLFISSVAQCNITLKVSILLCMYISEGYVILSPTQLIISLMLTLGSGNMFRRYLNCHHQAFQ
jgi:hypothetical protein